MAANKLFRLGPVALSATLTTNILNPGTTTGGVNSTGGVNANLRITLRHIRITNKDTVARTYSLYIGASGANAAGTEFMGTASVVPANSFVDWYGAAPLDVGDFLVGGASAATTLTLNAEGEIGVA